MPYNNSISTTNGSMQYFQEMYQYIEKYSKLLGCHFVNVNEEMGVNVWNMSEYMTDGIHPATTQKGINALSYALISHIKNIYPK